MAKFLAILLFSMMVCVSDASQSNCEDDRGPDLSKDWPISATLSILQEDGLVDAGQIDSTSATRLASARYGPFWNQVYFVVFTLHDGKTVEAITNVQPSATEDPEGGGLVVYAVSKVLQPEGKPLPAKRDSVKQ